MSLELPGAGGHDEVELRSVFRQGLEDEGEAQLLIGPWDLGGCRGHGDVLHIIRVNPMNDRPVQKSLSLRKQVAFIVFSLRRPNGCNHYQTKAGNDFLVHHFSPNFLSSLCYVGARTICDT